MRKKARMAAVGGMALCLLFTGCGKEEKEAATEIVNGSFEAGVDNPEGWTKEGTAFSSRGIVAAENDYKVGENYFDGFEAGNQQFTGTLTSDIFRFEGLAITFKIGGGKNPEKVFVEIYEEGKDTPIAAVGNTAFSEPTVTTQLIREVVEIPEEYQGKNLYIRITDQDTSDDMAYVLLDDFRILNTAEEVTACKEERKNLLDALNPPFEEDENATDIVNGNFEDGTMHGWKFLSGRAFSSDVLTPATEQFWGERDFLAEGSYFVNGYHNAEEETGTMRSTKFTLAGDGYLSFLLGGSGSDSCYVAVCSAKDDAELIRVYNKAFKDPELSLNLHREYVDASEYLGEVLYLKVVDQAAAGGFGAITVDDFRVSMTKAEVRALMKETYEAAMQMEDTSVNEYVKSYYKQYEYPFPLEIFLLKTPVAGKTIAPAKEVDLTKYLEEAEFTVGEFAVDTKQIDGVNLEGQELTGDFTSFDLSVPGSYQIKYSADYQGQKLEDSFILEAAALNQVANGGFETGDAAGWKLVEGTARMENAVSSDTAFWGEGIPYNAGGSYHWNGWNAGEESETYTIRSTPFVLEGSGYISFKAGGNAAVVRVCREDGTTLAEYTNPCFADVNFPNVADGCRLATMTTYVADLSGYLGESLYIELSDSATENWGIAFFDDIITYYKTAPVMEEGFDIVAQNGEENIQIAWEKAVSR